MNILNRPISFFESAKNANTIKDISIYDAIELIKGEQYLKITADLRKALSMDEVKYKEKKKLLNAVTFSATFSNIRKKANLKEYSQIMSIDIDKLEKNEKQKTFDILTKDEHVFCFWTSPSNNGVKGLIELSFENVIDNANASFCHKKAFGDIFKYFNDMYGVKLDENCSDISRLCFLSHDTNIVLKENFKPFVINKFALDAKKTAARSGENYVGDDNSIVCGCRHNNDAYYRKKIQSIIRYLVKNNLSITYSFKEWQNVAFIIASCFSYIIGEKYFISLSKIDKDKYDEYKCKKQLKWCYSNKQYERSFQSLIKLAQAKGYIHYGG